MAKPLDTENLRGVFNKIMQTNQLKPQDVKKERSNIAIPDKGEFDCAGCCHKWQSNFSWITFDLIEMKIVHRWRMKCKYCLSLSQPTFTVSQLERMYEKAVRYYKGETDNQPINIGRNARRAGRQDPHIPYLCEKCRWGLDQCWIKRYCY